AELHLPDPGAAQGGGQVRGPQALPLDLFLQRLGRLGEQRLAVSAPPPVAQYLERADLLPNEAAHPLKLDLELGFDREVPAHGRGPPLGVPWQLMPNSYASYPYSVFGPSVPAPWAPAHQRLWPSASAPSAQRISAFGPAPGRLRASRRHREALLE